MKYYLFNILEQANDIEKHFDMYSWEYKPSKCQTEKLIIKLEENDITILNKNMVPQYFGKLNTYESITFPNKQLKLVYNLDESLSFIGGKFILENKKGTLIHMGSGLSFFAAFRGSITNTSQL